MTTRDLIASTGLSQSEAARVLHVPLRTLQAWCSGERRPSEPTRKLLSLMASDPSLIERVRAA